MLHVRTTCRAERTDDLVDTVSGSDGTASTTVARGVVVSDGPGASDMVETDVARRALRSGRTVVVALALAIAATAGAMTLLHLFGQVPPDYLDGRRPLTLFITSPNGFAVATALLAGVAGTVSLTASKSSSLVGAFISVTTVPAATEIATAGVTGQGAKAGAAAVVLGINVLAIVVAAVLTLLVQRLSWARLEALRGEAHPAATSSDPSSQHPGEGAGSPHALVRRAPHEPWQHLRAAHRRARTRPWGRRG